MLPTSNTQCHERLLYFEYPFYAPENVHYGRMREELISHEPVGCHYGAPGSLLSAVAFFGVPGKHVYACENGSS